MKNIMIIILVLLSSNLYSQWSYLNIRTSTFVGLNKDTLNLFVDHDGWYTSWNNGLTWKKDIYLNNSEVGLPLKSYYYHNNIVIIAPWYNGIFYSEDYGKSFYQSMIDFGKNGNTSLGHVHQIQKYKEYLYLGSDYGLFVSTDNGKNWIKKARPSFNRHNREQEHSIELLDFAIIDNEIFLTSFYWYGGILKTVDNKHDSLTYLKIVNSSENYFENINLELPNNFKSSGSKSIELVNNTIYAVVDDKASRRDMIIYSDDLGATYNFLNLEFSNNFEEFEIRELVSCGDILYLVVKEYGIYMSDNLGKSWVNISDGFLEKSTNPAYSMYFHNLQFNENYAFVINGFGLYRANVEDCKIVSEISIIEYQDNIKSSSVYPNPTSNILTLKISKPMKLELYDIYGKIILEKFDMKLDLSNLKTGTYYLKYNGVVEKVLKI